jgi:hypothetical protein
MGNIAGSPPNFGGIFHRYEVVLHGQSAFDRVRGKDALAYVYDRATGNRDKQWLTLDEALAMCKLLNESEKL